MPNMLITWRNRYKIKVCCKFLACFSLSLSGPKTWIMPILFVGQLTAQNPSDYHENAQCYPVLTKLGPPHWWTLSRKPRECLPLFDQKHTPSTRLDTHPPPPTHPASATASVPPSVHYPWGLLLHGFNSKMGEKMEGAPSQLWWQHKFRWWWKQDPAYQQPKWSFCLALDVGVCHS